jgi:hypothetical protein
LLNPSKRNEKAKFLIHIGNGFIVDSYCVRLDKLEPPMFGANSPEDWLIEICHDYIYQRNPTDSCYYKSFIVELEVKLVTRDKRYDSSSTIIKLKERIFGNSKLKMWKK